MDSLLRIKIKTLDNSLYEIEILRENTIIELKSKIETVQFVLFYIFLMIFI